MQSILRGEDFKLLSFSGFHALISFIYVINILPHEGQFQQTSTKKFFKYEFVSTNGIVPLIQIHLWDYSWFYPNGWICVQIRKKS